MEMMIMQCHVCHTCHMFNVKLMKLPPFHEEKDDLDAYLNRFERACRAFNVPQGRWSFQLARFLQGQALGVYQRMTDEDVGDYESLKSSLLKRFRLTERGYRNGSCVLWRARLAVMAHSQPPHRRPPPRGALSVARTLIFSGENNARTGANTSTPTSLTYVTSGDPSTNYWVEVGCHLQTLTSRTCTVTSITKSPQSAPLLLVQTHHHSLTARPPAH